MGWFSFFLLLSSFFITIVIVQRSSSALTNDQKKLKSDRSFTLLDKISSITGNGNIQKDVDDLRCPEKWSRFGYSCYFLPNGISMTIQANQTCYLIRSNNSRLMYIQQSIELYYAAYVLSKNNLDNLLLEVDQDLMKGGKIANMLSSDDHVQWEEFGKKILQDNLKNYKEKTQSTKHLLRNHRDNDENKIERKSTSVVKDKMDNDDKDENKFENIEHIRNACYQIKWNVVDQNSNVLILTVEMNANNSICSLNNTNISAAYSHMCQYVLDRCLNNIACGKHGRCINSETGFNCSCSFLYDGLFCDKFSINDIQLLIALPILFIAPLLLITTTRKLLRDVIKWLINHLRRQRTMSHSSKKDENREQDDQRPMQNQQASRQHSNNRAARTTRTEFKLSRLEQHIRFILVLILSFVFFLILIGIPAIIYFMPAKMNDTNSYKLDSLINNRSHMGQQYERNTVLRIDNTIFLIISIVLSIIFFLLNTQDQSDDDHQSRIIEPIKVFYITDRWKTAGIITIQMFEILKILDETLIDISEASHYGIFVKIIIRMVFIFINGFRYYPILASFQFQDIRVRFLTFAYVIGSMVYMIIHESSHMYWLSFFKKVSLLEQTDLYMDMNLWLLMYSFTKNCLYCFLIGYIGAELTMRLVYDSIYIALKNGRSIWEITYRKIDKYSVLKGSKIRSDERVTSGGNNTARSDNSDQQGCCSDIRKFFTDQFRNFRIYVTEIYKWEDNFRYTTIVICTYTTAFIFLFYLTCNLIFLYTTEKKNYVTYLKRILERILNIAIKEKSFQGEVVFSAIITMIFLGIQLLHSIKNYKDCVKKLYKFYSDGTESGLQFEDHEIIPKSLQYPAFILRYLFGGFVICFHLILIIVILPNMSRTQVISSKWKLISIASAISVYGLHKIINQAANKLFTGYNSQNQNNVRLNRPYSILLYFNLIASSFIGIISSIIRLITSVLVNILFIPRIDYSCLVPPLQRLDSAHVAFQCFIRWELLYRPEMRNKLSDTTEQPAISDIPARETNPEQIQQGDDYQDAEENAGTQADLDTAHEIRQNNSAAGTSTSEPPSQPHNVGSDPDDVTQALLPEGSA